MEGNLLGGLAAGGGPSFDHRYHGWLLLPAAASARYKANQPQSSNNMKQIAMAEMAYIDEMGKLSADLIHCVNTKNYPQDCLKAHLPLAAWIVISLPTDGFLGAQFPIMVEDPANYNFKHTSVVFGDLSVRRVDGEAAEYYYNFIRELSEKAKAEGRAITQEDMKAFKEPTDSMGLRPSESLARGSFLDPLCVSPRRCCNAARPA